MKDYTGCWLASAAFAIDRITKWLAMSRLRGAGYFDALPGVLRLVYVENTGAAFGLFSQRSASLAWMTAPAIVGLLVFLFFKGKALPKTVRLSLWFLAGGAAGNFFDRFFLGYVVDFLEIRFFSFPVFNFADCFVTASTIWMMGFILFHKEARPGAK